MTGADIIAAVGVAGGIVAALKFTWEMSQGRRWTRAATASNLLDQFYSDAASRDALIMLDWDGRPFAIDAANPTALTPIRHQDIIDALRIQDVGYDPLSLFIRTRIDRLFELFDRVGHSLRIGLIEFGDVEYALEFYVARRLAQHKPTVLAYMNSQGFDAGLEFFERSPEWRAAG